MQSNKDFYKFSKKYALDKLTKAYMSKSLSLAQAKEQAKKHLDELLKPVKDCNINNSKADLSAIYRRLLVSCQNRTMMTNVIKFDANRTIFEKLLKNFEPKKILAKYKTADDVYSVFEKKFGINKDHNKLWKLFAESVIDGANFMNKFASVADFKQTIDNIATHFKGTLMIPTLISGEIRGLGGILACDFIKEIGYIDYAKPDVHIEYIIKKLCKNENMTSKEILNRVQKIAQDSGVSTFEIDKILWLIASGKYYDIYQIKPTIMVKSKHAGQSLRDEFLASLPK